jgi:hypothetical protein
MKKARFYRLYLYRGGKGYELQRGYTPSANLSSAAVTPLP